MKMRYARITWRVMLALDNDTDLPGTIEEAREIIQKYHCDPQGTLEYYKDALTSKL